MYYHFSPIQLTLGTTLKHTGENYSVSGTVEQILEANRPKDNFPRNQSVYAVRRKVFDQLGLTYDRGFIHIVTLCGKIDQRDCGWIGELQKRKWPHPDMPLTQNQQMTHLSDDDVARKYWCCESTSEPNWEFVSHTALVLWRLPCRRSLSGQVI